MPKSVRIQALQAVLLTILFFLHSSNPIAYVDPSGNIVIINGDDAYRIEIMKQLRELTSLNLSMDKNGKVTITKPTEDSKTPKGDALLAGLIVSGHTVTIKYAKNTYAAKEISKDDARNPYVGTGSTVFYDPYTAGSIELLTENKSGNPSMQTAPAYIVLGHELIHAYYMIKGQSDRLPEEYTYTDSNGRTIYTYAEAEELLTVGLTSFTNPVYTGRARDYTENALREEHGLPKRVAY
ncbi:type III secretion system effector protein [Oscillospiraceae bacterium OttesenSCG-928-G22]|nr:type III secretion system effector protein [Oscillospiraceae bacterium OttesenSCG-928-G22]